VNVREVEEESKEEEKPAGLFNKDQTSFNFKPLGVGGKTDEPKSAFSK